MTSSGAGIPAMEAAWATVATRPTVRRMIGFLSAANRGESSTRKSSISG